MAKKMVVAAAALQYSKRLSKFICWVWALYRFMVVTVSAAVPEAANALVSTIAGIDTIMMANVSTYLINSLGEKIIYSDRFAMKWLDKGGFKHVLGKITNRSASTEEEGDEEDGDNTNG